MEDENDETTEEDDTDDDDDNDDIRTETTNGTATTHNYNENSVDGCGDDGGGYLRYWTGDDGVCNFFPRYL